MKFIRRAVITTPNNENGILINPVQDKPDVWSIGNVQCGVEISNGIKYAIYKTMTVTTEKLKEWCKKHGYKLTIEKIPEWPAPL